MNKPIFKVLILPLVLLTSWIWGAEPTSLSNQQQDVKVFTEVAISSFKLTPFTFHSKSAETPLYSINLSEKPFDQTNPNEFAALAGNKSLLESQSSLVANLANNREFPEKLTNAQEESFKNLNSCCNASCCKGSENGALIPTQCCIPKPQCANNDSCNTSSCDSNSDCCCSCESNVGGSEGEGGAGGFGGGGGGGGGIGEAGFGGGGGGGGGSGNIQQEHQKEQHVPLVPIVPPQILPVVPPQVPVPEPSTWLLMSGMAGLVIVLKRLRDRRAARINSEKNG